MRTLSLLYSSVLILLVCAAEYAGLAIDIGRQILYYSDQTGKLGELSTNGTNHRVLVSAVGSKPRAIVIDDVNRYYHSNSLKTWLLSVLHGKN